MYDQSVLPRLSKRCLTGSALRKMSTVTCTPSFVSGHSHSGQRRLSALIVCFPPASAMFERRTLRSQKDLIIRTFTMERVPCRVAHLMFLCSVAVRAFTRPTTVRSFRTSLAMTARGGASVATNNPLLQQEGLPRFAEIEPKDLTPAVEELLEKLESDFKDLETKLSSASEVDYEVVLPEVERMQFPIEYTWGVAGHLNAVKNGDELREAYQANQPKIVKALTQFKQSKPVFEALSAIEQAQKVSDDSFYTRQKKRAVENSLRSMKLGGVGLEGEAKESFNTMKMRLAELATKFSNNVLDETKAFSLTITDASQMDGVPDSAKSMWANAHVNYLKQNEEEKTGDLEMDAEKGPWRITLDMPSYIAVMSHVKDRSVREQVYKAYLQRASDNERNNTPIIYETLKLKTSMAKMLGFENYAEQSLSSKMATSVEAVRELTDLIAAKALPAAEKELAEITALAREKGGDEYNELKHWDVTYWSERLKESKYNLKEEETRPYFALPAVLEGMFKLVSRIFDIEVQSADGEVQVWHSDVQFFKVFDKESGKHIASFFLDPYSRPENKRGGAWMNVCIGKSEACGRDTPVAYLTCNGSPPVGSKPSLMTFREVTTLFHEFGHGLQHMLTTATVGDVAGISGVEWDAVELPSQFMENWLFDKSTVYGFAKHWETGEPMPEDMFDKLDKQRMYGTGMATCRQLVFGQIDLELHSVFDAEAGEKGEGESVFDVQRRISSKYVPYMMPLPEDRFLCSFSHIFAGGYAAGYYSYKWAEVMSADAFAAFEEVGLDNEEEVKKVGRKFRNTVLSLGGGVEPMEVFKQFRGREPRPDALLRHNGLE